MFHIRVIYISYIRFIYIYNHKCLLAIAPVINRGGPKAAKAVNKTPKTKWPVDI